MAIIVKPSDLFYRYPKNHANKQQAKFSGKPDDHVFDVDDLFEVIPMLEAVMNHYACIDGNLLNELEDVLVRWIPKGLNREQVFDILVEAVGEYFHKD